MARPLTVIALIFSTLVGTSLAQTSDDARRTAISTRGKALFQETKNHCHAFRDLIGFAVDKTSTPAQLLEDLKYVLIGEDLRRRGTGKYYIGNVKGARGDSGFKPELRDSSPQVEHAMAAIHIGKTMPPGTAEVIALKTEIMGPLLANGSLNAQDALLYSLGADIGQRLSASNFKELPKVIQRTMCD